MKVKNVNNCQFQGKYAATVWFILKKGRISKIEGVDKVLKDPVVIHFSQRLNIGDIVTNDVLGTEAQVFARLYIVTSTYEERREKIKFIQNTINVRDEYNELMQLNGFQW